MICVNMESQEKLIAKIQHYYELIAEYQQKIEDSIFENNELNNKKKELEAKAYVIKMAIDAFEDLFHEIIYIP